VVIQGRVKQTVIIGVSLLLAAGCATTFWWGSPSNVKSTTLSLGMSKPQVQAMFGRPRTIAVQQVNDMVIETWKYLNRTLVFQDGVLQSWQSAVEEQSR